MVKMPHLGQGLFGKQENDPGFGEEYHTGAKRLINRDGTFNVKRKFRWQDVSLYQELITMHWLSFSACVFLFYIAMNLLFSAVYLFIGIEYIVGPEEAGGGTDFWRAFSFSYQTFTTVGYGVLNPIGLATNLVASVEAMTGFLSFALLSGLLFGRFSKPSHKIKFSKNAIIAPYKDGLSFQIRIANYRKSDLMEVEAEIIYTHLEHVGDDWRRKYYRMTLEPAKVMFLPLNWTIVHPINESSPLFHMREKELFAEGSEFLVRIKGYDDTYTDVIQIKTSYCADDLVWGAKWKPSFTIDSKGDTEFDVDSVDDYEEVELRSSAIG